ncbi:MAG TPA: MaoC family dehydratase [Chloroflexota bacterium]|jgi:acyl dehydratase|nr:MaoC family dehydratase [Chloroflexota bacterium]
MADEQPRVIKSVQEYKEVVGQETRVSDWFEVTQDRVDQFAEVTGDHQWIHVDQERAKTGPFGGTIAHGLLTLSVGPMMRGGQQLIRTELPSRMGLNYGYNRIRFINPVHVGKRIRSRSKLLSVEEVQPGIVQVINEVTIEIEGEAKPAMVAEHVTRTYLAT